MVKSSERPATKSYSSSGVIRSVPLVDAALGVIARDAMVLDATLHVVAFSPSARGVIGEALAVGARITSLLRGKTSRSLDRLSARGQPFRTLVSRRVEGAERDLRVHAVPIATSSDQGWLLQIEDLRDGSPDRARNLAGMWTQDAAMLQVFRQIEAFARSDEPVLVRGESGSGKSVTARAIHDLSPRASGPFITVSCAAFARATDLAFLLGDATDSFDSPAPSSAIARARGGTLFLDEVIDLPADAQARIAAWLGDDPAAFLARFDVRIVASTSRAPLREIELGNARAGLVYRLSALAISLPPLRARSGDVALLSQKIVASLDPRWRTISTISSVASELLERHAWHGNVRELVHAIRHAQLVGDGEILAPGDLPSSVVEGASHVASRAPASVTTAENPVHAARLHDEIESISHALQRTSGNRSRAAQVLGVSRITLWRRMRALGIS